MQHVVTQSDLAPAALAFIYVAKEAWKLVASIITFFDKRAESKRRQLSSPLPVQVVSPTRQAIGIPPESSLPLLPHPTPRKRLRPQH
jgi:hypothetical protein